MKIAQHLLALAMLASMPAFAGVLSDIVAVAAGGYHTCALTSSGGVKCWGDNIVGQLGNGTFTSHSTPVDVVGLGSGVISIAAGQTHTCALTSAGGVKCWGNNGYGQLGTGAIDVPRFQPTPVDVVGLSSGVVSITTTGDQGRANCALTIAGTAKCWGENSSGQLGDGTMASTGTPVNVTVVPSPIAMIEMGGGHACALDTAGGVKCWGSGMQGQLGHGAQEIRTDAVSVVGLASGVRTIDVATQQSCAIMAASGGAKCWGVHVIEYPPYPPLLYYEYQLTPVDVPGLASGVASIAAGNVQTCALTSAGGVKCWGFGGYVGDGTGVTRPDPVDVVGLTSGVAQIAVGWGQACAVTVAGNVKCWGSNFVGQLGNRTVSGTPAAAPVTVAWFVAQAIDFDALADRDITASPFSVSATASSGLAVTLTSLTPWVCTISGTTVSLASAGVCAIAADQAGDDVYDFAPQVVRTFVVSAPPSPLARLVNLSTRGDVLSGEQVMIAGFVISGSTPKTVAMRVSGASLAAYGLSYLPGSSIELYSGSTLVASNFGWKTSIPSGSGFLAPGVVLPLIGLAPASVSDPALIGTLPPGAYTAIVRRRVSGFDITGDIALFELYELDRPETPFINISTRARVGTGNDVMIAGFIINGSGPQEVVINVAGPSLAEFGITNPLADPTLTLVRSSDNTIIATSDNWQREANAGAIAASGFAPRNPLEPAIMMTLPPGAYTAIVRGAGDSTGVAVVGVFATP